MTRVRFICAMAGAATVLAVLALTTSPAAAQSLASNPPVKIENNNSGTRKICFHKPKKITLFAIGCVTLKSGEHIFWNRKGIFTPFKVRIYEKRKLIDKFLFARDLPADTGKINIGFGGGLGFARFKNIDKKFTIRACNSNQEKKVWLAVGYDLPRAQFSRGWWGIEKGKCINIGVSKWLKEKHNYPYATIPRLYYFARTYGDKPRFWTSGNDSKLFCIDQDKKFALRNGNISNACGTGHEPQPYRFLKAPTARSNEVVQLNF